MANANYDGKYLRCDISFVRDALVGGRLYSAQFDQELPNGVVGYIADIQLDVLPHILFSHTIGQLQ